MKLMMDVLVVQRFDTLIILAVSISSVLPFNI
jgi:hypothetical protein